MNDPFEDCTEVTLSQMLDAREARAARQRQMQIQHPMTLVCLTLNVAGPVKDFPLARKTFAVAFDRVGRALTRAGLAVEAQDERRNISGNEGYFSVTGEAVAVKRLMVALEDAEPAARLFDIDVLRQDGSQISRTELGLPGRHCLLCDETAVVCARSRAHPVEALMRRTLWLMAELVEGRFADFVASQTVRALLYEVCVTPKPGLVDRENNGAHRDMDMFVFADSIAVLFPYFRTCARVGMHEAESAPARILAALRGHGLDAEDAMRRATGGVNTHKGAIFTLGLLAAAAGTLWQRGETLTPEALTARCGDMGRAALADYQMLTPEGAKTAGERQYLESGSSGARGEAAGGLESVLTAGLPMLQHMLQQGATFDQAGSVALLHLMRVAGDSNITARSGVERRNALHRELDELLNHTPMPDRVCIDALDARLIRENISPGGCADLLAASFLLYFLCDEEPKTV